MRRFLVLAIKLILTVGIFWFMFTKGPVPLDKLVEDIRDIEPGRFVPWVLAGVAIKLVGIFGNIWRWQLLLRGQDLHLDYRFLAGSFFIGRFFGIVTPGTLGLDGFKLYDSIRVTKAPVECAAVIAIDKVIGLVGLACLLVIVFPIGWTVLPGFDDRKALMLVGAMIGATSVFFAILLAPALTRPLLRLLPIARLRAFAERVFESATAYADHRRILLGAVGLAAVGHLTTAFMYWTLAMGLGQVGAEAPAIGLVIFAALVMTSFTLVAPTVGGEGVRELTFTVLLGGQAFPETRSFMVGHFGFWIEKGLLGLPGGLIYAMRKAEYDGPITRADLERVRAEALAAGAD